MPSDALLISTKFSGKEREGGVERASLLFAIAMHANLWVPKKWFQNLIMLQNGLGRLQSYSQKAHKTHHRGPPVSELLSSTRFFTKIYMEAHKNGLHPSMELNHQLTHVHTHTQRYTHAVIFPVDGDDADKIALNPKQVIYRVIQQTDEQNSTHTQSFPLQKS